MEAWQRGLSQRFAKAPFANSESKVQILPFPPNMRSWSSGMMPVFQTVMRGFDSLTPHQIARHTGVNAALTKLLAVFNSLVGYQY